VNGIDHNAGLDQVMLGIRGNSELFIIDQIMPPVDAAGNYTIATGSAFGPAAPVWTYTSTPASSFYSAEISGRQRLPNGNTLICEGVKGNLFEVTSAGIRWVSLADQIYQVKYSPTLPCGQPQGFYRALRP
jgi:hypothetical protein